MAKKKSAKKKSSAKKPAAKKKPAKKKPGKSMAKATARKSSAKKPAAKKAAKKKRPKARKRELIDTGTDKRFVRRDDQGQFQDVVDVGRSLAADIRQPAVAQAPSGLGDLGD
jgi:hypothetical protein